MSVNERIREHRDDLPSEEELRGRQSEGWRVVAVEWERGPGSTEVAAASPKHEIPYGLRPSSDGLFLEDHPEELATLRQILSGMVDDVALSAIAETLNEEGQRTRHNRHWKQGDLFDLLPRIVEVGADILRSEAWSDERKDRQLRAV